MRRIRYLGPGHVVVLSNGERVERGQEADVPEADAAYMADSLHVWIDILPPAPRRKRRRYNEPISELDNEPEAVAGEGHNSNEEE
jgi:hypothetical protein